VADSESRKTFIKHAIRFLRQYQFDGLDLDWEYPASREGGVPEDKKNYAIFIQVLSRALFFHL
jgi:chitinase